MDLLLFDMTRSSDRLRHAHPGVKMGTCLWLVQLGTQKQFIAPLSPKILRMGTMQKLNEQDGFRRKCMRRHHTHVRRLHLIHFSIASRQKQENNSTPDVGLFIITVF